MPGSKSIAARRHAHAAFAIAIQENRVEQWAKDLRNISTVLEERELKALLESPRIPLRTKLSALRESLESINPMALNLALFLVTKGRISLASDIAAEFEQLMDAQRGFERAEVTTAIPLDPAEQERVTQFLSRVTNKQIKLSTRVDPSIGGGLIAKIRDRILDGSVRAKLQDMKKSLVAGGAQGR